LISDELHVVAVRSILALYAGLSVFYTLGVELTFGRLRSGRDAFEAGIAYGLHFLWGLGLPIVLSYILLSHSATTPSLITLALALRLNWEALALRIRSMRECGASYDRRIETFFAGSVFEKGVASGDKVIEKALATTGPYGDMRHPGFAAHILQQTANALLVVAFFHQSGTVAAMAVVGLSAALAYIIFDSAARSEEKSLRKMPSYEEYMQKVPLRFSLLPSYIRDLQTSTSDVLGQLHGLMIHGSLRSVYVRLLALVQGVSVEYVDPVREPEVVDRVLSATGDKGTFVEDLAACPAWRPILSVESVDVPTARDLRSRLERVKAALRIDERIPGIVDSALEDLRARLKGKASLDHGEVCHLTFDVFFRLLTGRAPDGREATVALKAVEEWKAEIALKKRADGAAKEALLSMMRGALRESEFFTSMGATFSPDDIADLSCIMQPLCISPMINFPDLMAGAKELLSKNPEWIARGAESEEAADMIVLETIRLRHPFPVLERACNNGQDERRMNPAGESRKRFRAGTQVFIEYDNRALLGESEFDPERWRGYVRLGKNHVTATVKTCPFKAVPFGAGPRRCAGQNLARGVLKRALRWILREFPLEESVASNPSPGWSWDRFEPEKGHKYTGRNNDENDQDTDFPYMVWRLLQILGWSTTIGFRRRVDTILLPQISKIVYPVSSLISRMSQKSKHTVPRAG